MAYRIAVSLAIGALILGSLMGCGGSGGGVKTVRVSGTVLLDDKPLDGANVVFIGDKHLHIGIAVTGPDGKYTLEKGAMPGQNMVSISKSKSGKTALQTGKAPQELAGDTPEAAPQPSDELLPAKYSNPVKPELTFDVPSGGTSSADFKLSSK